MTVTWRPVVGYEGQYEVSSDGQVRSFKQGAPRILCPADNPGGYPAIALCVNGTQRTIPIHRLVAAAFLGPRPPGLETRHLDGDKHHNSPSNLAYGDRSSNELDQVRHGTHPNTRKTHCPRGHPYDEENTYLRPGPRRHRACRACKPVWDARTRERQRQREWEAPGAPAQWPETAEVAP